MKCQVHGCNAESKVWVSKGGVARRVCWRCEEELVAVSGWVTTSVPEENRKRGPRPSKKM